MRAFRFPRWTIFLMLLIFASTMFAIEEGRSISRLHSGELRFEAAAPGLYGLFVFLGVVLCSIGVVGFGILFALRESGAQRFPNIRTWDQRR